VLWKDTSILEDLAGWMHLARPSECQSGTMGRNDRCLLAGRS